MDNEKRKPTIVICPQCGEQNSTDNDACSHCGALLPKE